MAEGPTERHRKLQETRRSYVNEQYPAYVRNNRPRARDLQRMGREARSFIHKPLISVVLPVHDPERLWLERALDSVMAQAYPHRELCICDDASSRDHVREILDRYQRLDDRIRIKHLKQNAGVSGASNAALSLASGEFVALLDHDDELSPDALFEVTKLLQEYPEADLIYSDEDKIDEEGNRSSPHFKPGWSPELLLCHNYITHLAVLRRSLLEEVGGFRKGFEGSQDYDLLLRFTEKTDEIHHIPKILYHWRMVEGSVTTGAQNKPYTHERSRRALSETLERRGMRGTVEPSKVGANFFRVRPEIEGSPEVSVIIPTRNNLDVLKKCVENIERRTTYRNYEILIVDNDSTDPATLEYLAGTPHRVLEFKEPFNHSKINNFAAFHAEGEYLLFVNDDTEVISGEWLEAMLEHAQRPEIGAVGARLLFPDGRVQHAGVPTGVGVPWTPGVATHIHHFFSGNSPGYVGAAKLVRNYSAVTAACAMVRRGVFEAVGGFDEENLPTAYNDVDLCLKIGERGYRIVYTPYAELYHHESISRKEGVTAEAQKYMRERWGETLDSDPYYNPNFSRFRGDFNLRADLLRPKILKDGEGQEEWEGSLREMSNEERQAYLEARYEKARSSSRTSLVPTASSRNVPPARRAPATTQPAPGDGSLKPFFIVGSARSGTTWLQRTLNSHPEIACKGEGMFFGRSMKLHERARTLHAALLNSEDLRVWHNMRVWTEGEFENFVPNLVRLIADSLFREELEKKPEAKVVGDKTPHYAFNLDEVHSIYPEARILHIIRDGRDVAVSNVHNFWRNAKDKGGPLNVPQPVISKRDEFLADPELFLSSKKSVFTKPLLSNLASKWRHDVEKGVEGGRLFGEGYMETEYEALLEYPGTELPRLLEFLGVGSDRSIVEHMMEEASFDKLSGGRKSGAEDPNSFFRKGVAGDWKNYFTEKDRQIFKEEAGELLIRLGYERDMSW